MPAKVVQIGEKYGLMNASNVILTRDLYDSIDEDGPYFVAFNSIPETDEENEFTDYFILDKTGDVLLHLNDVIDMEFSDPTILTEDFITFRAENYAGASKSGMLSIDGILITEPKYENISLYFGKIITGYYENEDLHRDSEETGHYLFNYQIGEFEEFTVESSCSEEEMSLGLYGFEGGEVGRRVFTKDGDEIENWKELFKKLAE